MPEQEPQVGQASARLGDLLVADTLVVGAATMASTRSSLWTLPFEHTTLPASIGPPETNTAGMLSRSAAISMPGVILSQLEMQTRRRRSAR
jgi:hypothetical protein